MFVTNWISTTKIQKISEITNFFRHYFLSRTEVDYTEWGDMDERVRTGGHVWSIHPQVEERHQSPLQRGTGKAIRSRADNQEERQLIYHRI